MLCSVEALLWRFVSACEIILVGYVPRIVILHDQYATLEQNAEIITEL